MIVYSILIVILGLTFLGIIFSRLSLVFPAIAIVKDMDFVQAFEVSKDYKLLIFVCVLLIPGLFGFLIGLIYGLVISFLMGLISNKLSVLLSLLNIFITVFTIGFLSITYEYIMSKQSKKQEKEEKAKEIEKAYVLLTNKNKQYTIEIFNIERKPEIKI